MNVSGLAEDYMCLCFYLVIIGKYCLSRVLLHRSITSYRRLCDVVDVDATLLHCSVTAERLELIL